MSGKDTSVFFRDPILIVCGIEFAPVRVCPGRWLSGGSLFMTIASVLHTLDIHPVPGPDGKRYDPFGHKMDGVNL